MEKDTRKDRALTAHQPGHVIRTGGFSSAGPERDCNEDAFALPKPWSAINRLGTLLVVADGVGGAVGGSAASRDAVAFLQSLYYSSAGSEQPGERLRECVEAVNAINRARRLSPDADAGSLTTLVAAVVFQDQIWIANVGDSRAYLIRRQEGERRQLTEDHNQQTRLRKTRPAPDPEGQADATGIIYRAIGLEDECQVDLYHYTWTPGDRLVLCTDGMALLPGEEMVQAALRQSPKQASKELVERSLKTDGSDNCTAIVASFESLEQVQAGSTIPPRSRARKLISWVQKIPLEYLFILLIGLFLGWISALVFFNLFIGRVF